MDISNWSVLMTLFLLVMGVDNNLEIPLKAFVFLLLFLVVTSFSSSSVSLSSEADSMSGSSSPKSPGTLLKEFSKEAVSSVTATERSSGSNPVNLST